MKFVILEVGYSCNAACKFCYNAWRTSKKQKYPEAQVLSKASFFSIIDSLKKWGVDTLGFSGGEPLLNPDLFEIAAYAKANGFKNSLLTNGILASKFASQIAENFEVVQISLQGLQATHDKLTGGVGNFQKALLGRTALMDYKVAVSAVVVVNRLNLTELKDTIALAAGMDMNSVLINRFLPGGKGLENTNLAFDENDLLQMLNLVEESSEEYGIPAFVGTPTPLCLEGLRSYKFLLKEGCMAGKGIHCAIDPSGGLRVCNHSPQVLGNCLERDPKEIYENSKYIQGFTELRYTPAMCKDCDKLSKCKGGCRESAHVLYGSLNDPDPIFQNRQKST